MPAETLLIRADATVAMGTGHLMRCLALAQAWQDSGGCCCFAIVEAAPALINRLRSENMEIEQITAPPGGEEDGAQLCNLAQNRRAAWVVVDGYHFGARYQKQIKEAECRLLFLYDYVHAEHY